MIKIGFVVTYVIKRVFLDVFIIVKSLSFYLGFVFIYGVGNKKK